MKKSGWNHFDQQGGALLRLSRTLSAGELAYCLALLVHADHKTGNTYIGPEKIAEETGFGIRVIKGAAAEMKRRGIVSIVEAGKRGHRGVVRLTTSVLSAVHRTESPAGIGEPDCTESDTNSVNHALPNDGELGAVHRTNSEPNSVPPTAPNNGYSVQSGARFGAVRRQNEVQSTAPSSTQLSTQSTKKGALARRHVDKSASQTDLPPSLDTPAFRAAWQDFETHRRESKNKLTSIAASRMLAKLAAWGPDKAITALNNSVENGWRGVFQPKAEHGNGNGYRHDEGSELVVERYPTPEEVAKIEREIAEHQIDEFNRSLAEPAIA